MSLRRGLSTLSATQGSEEPQKGEQVSADNPWITTRITEARKKHPAVTDAASSRIEGLLSGQISEQQLPQAELKSIAATLIQDMVPVPPKTKQ